MLTVDDGWPDYWQQVEVETAKVGSSRAVYVALDHDHVVDWFTRHWDLRVIGMEAGGTIRLVEFALID